jgi:hypothetical protein
LPPDKVIFLSHNWQEIGMRSDLTARLSVLTNIDEKILRGDRAIHDASVAQRMSWAAGRQTSRPEDRAYSLLGIFDINMPMLYGEGDKAFLRLQQEILKSEDDQSLLAWIGPPSRFGILADSPDRFIERCRRLEKDQILGRIKSVASQVSNKGLGMELICWRGGPLPSLQSKNKIRRHSSHAQEEEGEAEDKYMWHAILECSWSHNGYCSFPVIALQAVVGTEDQFWRVQPDVNYRVDKNHIRSGLSELRKIYEEATFGELISACMTNDAANFRI